MKLAVDTNILFSFFWKDSLTRKLLLTSNFELISPEIALEEIKKYSGEISEKLKINRKEFELCFNDLKKTIKFTPKKEYSQFLNEAQKIFPDKNDAEFFALCLRHSYALWSNDIILKNQDKIKVISTQDLVEIML